MQLESSISVRRSPEDVWAYLGDVSNVAVWDRGVSRVETNSSNASGVGFEFDTLAYPRGRSTDGSWGKMSYRISDVDAVRGCAIRLTSAGGNARYFKSAEWRFRVEPYPSGSRIHCAVQFALKWQFLILAPVFLCMKKAIHSDLVRLKRALEGDLANTGTATPSSQSS